MAFSKSVLVLFILQLLLSAACISTASASSMHINASNVFSATHCHKSIASLDTHEHSMTTCGHCDSSDKGFYNQIVHQMDMVPVLLAIVTSLETATHSNYTRVSQIKHAAPPNSSFLLYTTTQRIRV